MLAVSSNNVIHTQLCITPDGILMLAEFKNITYDSTCRFYDHAYMSTICTCVDFDMVVKVTHYTCTLNYKHLNNIHRINSSSSLNLTVLEAIHMTGPTSYGVLFIFY